MSRANKRFDSRLAHSLIKFVNMQSGANKNNPKAKKKRFYAFNESTLDKIMNHVNLEFVKSALVIGDAGLQVVDRLVNAGITDITVALARLDRTAKYYEPVVYSINSYINYYFSTVNITITHFEELTSMNKKKFDLIIANPPYGSIGANITKTVIDNLDFDQYINLLPANDYFISPINIYKFIDPSLRPTPLKAAFEDATQTTTLSKIGKKENQATKIDLRLQLCIVHADNSIWEALAELWRRTAAQGTLNFKQTGAGKDLLYDDNIFTFNSGAFDIHHGYFAVAKKKVWTKATLYNVYHQAVNGNMVTSAVTGCNNFKKLIYSETGLKMLKLWFSSSPEGWGLLEGMFADLDYSKCATWEDVFNILKVSCGSQQILFKAANEKVLTEREKEICHIVARMDD